MSVETEFKCYLHFNNKESILIINENKKQIKNK